MYWQCVFPCGQFIQKSFSLAGFQYVISLSDLILASKWMRFGADAFSNKCHASSIHLVLRAGSWQQIKTQV